MREIQNASECSNGSCHVHQAGTRILGVIDTTLSMAVTDRQMETQRTGLTWFLVMAMMIGSGAAILFMWVVVHRA